MSRNSDPAVRELIEDLHVAYAHSLDDLRIDEWPTFFTEMGLYRITTRENLAAGLPIGIINCIGRGMMEDRVKALHTANIFEPHTYNHLIGPAQIEADGPGRFRVRSNFQIVRTMETGRMDLFATGKYADLVIAEEGGLRFQERVVILDSGRVDILLVIPL